MACADTDFLVMMLRVVLDDLDDSNYTYTDEKLIKVLSVATKIVFAEIHFEDEYEFTINFSTPSLEICPDITDLISSLIVMKAACLIDAASMRSQTLIEGIRANCGPIQIQKSSGGKAFELLMSKGPCAAYNALKRQVEFTDRISGADYFKAILGPFISNTYFPCNTCGGCRRTCGCGC